MILPRRIPSLMAAGALSSVFCLPTASRAQEQARPENASPHFAAVAKHLETGGQFFQYMDMDGDIGALAQTGNEILETIRMNGGGIRKGYDFAPILRATGLDCIKAIGLSSRKTAEGLYHNRALLYMPDGPRGFMTFTGGKPAPMAIASWAPADAGAALQLDISPAKLPEVVMEMLKGAGEAETAKTLDGVFNSPMPPLGGISMKQMLAKMNTRVMLVMRIDESKRLSIPGSPAEIPAIQMMAALDDVDFLMPLIVVSAKGKDGAEVEEAEDHTTIRVTTPLPGDMSWYEPGVYHDKKAHRIVFTTHLDMALKAGKGAVLGSSEAYKKATAGLPVEANGIQYVTPQFSKVILEWVQSLMDEGIKEGDMPLVQAAVSKAMVRLMAPVATAPVASVYANLPDGMLVASNATTTHKLTSVQGILYPAMFIGVAVGGYQGFMKAPGRRAGEDPAPEKPRETPEAPEAAQKTVKNNLQQISFAAQAWFPDNPAAKEVSYETLVKSELLFDLDSVAGESYKGLTIKRAGGELSVKLKNGDSVSLKYSAATD